MPSDYDDVIMPCSTMDTAPKFTLESWLKLAEQEADEQPETTPMRLIDFIDERLAISGI
jgi:hypothetical protein